MTMPSNSNTTTMKYFMGNTYPNFCHSNPSILAVVAKYDRTGYNLKRSGGRSADICTP